MYVDSSALVKLLVEESESAVLQRALADARLVSSSLALVEVPRAVGRRDVPAAVGLVPGLLEECLLVGVEDHLLEAAALLAPPSLRSLDAVHLATALSVRDRLDAVVAYDIRLVHAAREHGLPVLTPGADL